VMASYARRVRALGATIVGACCGSTPAHIRAMAEALRMLPDLSLDDITLTTPTAERGSTDTGRQSRDERRARRG
jgi:hypothetical protein